MEINTDRDGLTLDHAAHCCALAELDGISRFKQAPEEVARLVLTTEGDEYDEKSHEYVETDNLNIPEVAHIIFTQAGRRRTNTGYGFAFRDYIHQKGLGTVTTSASGINPNSGNHVVTFVWTLNKKGITTWAKRKGYKT